MKLVRVIGWAGLVFVLSCEATPLAAPESASTVTAIAQASAWRPINGTMDIVGVGAPGGVLITPGGQCHFTDLPVLTRLSGDVAGLVTFHESNETPCAGGHLIGSGPFEGDVTVGGVSGTISGQWTTNCKPDASQPAGVSCDGTMNARGSGRLEDVQLHFKWGPGWFPFPYSGVASSQ
jgi:hypothetical protein